ncbi:hypothetical protein BJY01DRAFT_251750 [Aspergillus pseudoustus]|uniref:Glyoxalase/fosfomycin resistance/dioxygenase domain-containing protein n=1 Tax=Aspergillus pseudoustus TaxID=1810923 RepID=A0ABR4J9Y2_9EURO
MSHLTYNRVFNHVAVSVPNAQAAVTWYTHVLGFQLIRNKIHHIARSQSPNDPIFTIYPPFLPEVNMAYMTTGNGVGFEIFEFVDPRSYVPEAQFEYHRGRFCHALSQDSGLTDAELLKVVTEAPENQPPLLEFKKYPIPNLEPVTAQEMEARDILTEFMSRSTESGILMDMCYHQPMTRNLQLAIQYGYEIIQGFTVVAAQFACQWKIWTGEDIPTREVFAMTERIVQERAELYPGIKATGRPIAIFEFNLKDHESIRDTFAAIWKSGVVPDILVNCAGITRRMLVENTPVKELDGVMAIYFRGAYLATLEFSRELLRLERHEIFINFASIAAFIAQTNISA